MNIELLEKRLVEKITNEPEQGVTDVLDILIKIVADNSERSDLTHYKVRLSMNKDTHSKGVVSSQDFLLEQNKILDSIINFIRVKLGNTPLITEWEVDSSVTALISDENEDILEIEDADFENDDLSDDGLDKDPDGHIVIPKYDIIIPSDMKEASVKKQFQLKMQQARDCIRSGSYDEANQICLEISNNIEDDSIQLQEFMLISLFKTTSAKEIIKDYIEEHGKIFSKLKLYAEKIKGLDEKHKSKKNTDSAIINITRVCRLILEEIKSIYKKKEFSGQKFNYVENDERPDIRVYYSKIIRLSMDIYALYPCTIFFETLLIEISGGGVIDWLYLDQNTYRDKAFKNFSKEGFEKKSSNMLYQKLKQKYQNINREKNSTGYFVWNDDKNRSIHKAVQSFIVAYKLYNDPKFLEIPWSELSGKEKLDWIDIDSSGLTIDKYIKNSLPKFNPINQLEILSKLLDPLNHHNRFNDAVKHIAIKKMNRTKREYKKDFEKSNAIISKNDLHNLIQHINNCRNCYKVYPEIDFINTGITYLQHTEKISLIKQIYAYPYLFRGNDKVCLDLNYNALYELKTMQKELISKEIKPLESLFIPKQEDSTDLPTTEEPQGEKIDKDNSSFAQPIIKESFIL
jgi:hypothetical protein